MEADKWDCWISLLPDSQNLGSVIGRLTEMWQTLAGSKKMINLLRKTLDKISFALHSYICHAFQTVNLETKSDSIRTAQFMLGDPACVLLCFEAFKIRQNCSLLNWFRKIKTVPTFDDAALKTRASLVTAFASLSRLPSELLRDHDYELMGHMLKWWQSFSDIFWKMSRAISLATISLNSFVGDPDSWQPLREKIDQCPEYESLCSLSIKSKSDLETQMEKICFDSMLRSKISIELPRFYLDIVELTSLANKLQYLTPHIGCNS